VVFELHGVRFVNASFGVAVGDYGLMMRTTDGGATWVQERNNHEQPPGY
jgi:photosystem II stability/assembly factor-like uncharacterized protein